MREITKEYLVLFNAITTAEESLRVVCEKLRFAQQAAEELYIMSESESTDENKKA